MMRTWIVVLAAVSLTAFLLAGCDDDKGPRVPGVFTVSLANLPQLPDTLYYEAFVRFDTTTTARALHVELDAVSIGTFIVDDLGRLRSRDGGPATFGLAESRDLNRAADVLVSVRARDDTTVGAPLLGGIVGGDVEEGRANVTTSYHDALGDNIRTAAGTCILATPSTAFSTDEDQGVWFVTSATTPNPSLTIPLLSGNWRYGSWIIQSGDTLGMGHFPKPDSLDSDGAGPPGQAGPLPGFDAPGSDFIIPARSFNDGLATVIVTIQPAADSEGPLSDEGPLFPIRVLELLSIPLGAATDSSMTLSVPAAALPSGDITFTR